MATINEIKQQAAAVKNATQVGENTAERVGGALAGLAEIAKQQEASIADETKRAKAAEEAIVFQVGWALNESVSMTTLASDSKKKYVNTYQAGKYLFGLKGNSDTGNIYIDLYYNNTMLQQEAAVFLHTNGYRVVDASAQFNKISIYSNEANAVIVDIYNVSDDSDSYRISKLENKEPIINENNKVLKNIDIEINGNYIVGGNLPCYANKHSEFIEFEEKSAGDYQIKISDSTGIKYVNLFLNTTMVQEDVVVAEENGIYKFTATTSFNGIRAYSFITENIYIELYTIEEYLSKQSIVNRLWKKGDIIFNALCGVRVNAQTTDPIIKRFGLSKTIPAGRKLRCRIKGNTGFVAISLYSDETMVQEDAFVFNKIDDIDISCVTIGQCNSFAIYSQPTNPVYIEIFDDEEYEDNHQYCNPVLATSVADPTIFDGGDGYYYLWYTGSWKSHLYRSANLLDWEDSGECPFTPSTIQQLDALAVQYDSDKVFYAPTVRKIGQYFVMYASISYKCMVVLRSLCPYGHYEFVGGPHVLLDSTITGLNITFEDSCVARDLDGTLYLMWGSWGKMYRTTLNNDGMSLTQGATFTHIAGDPSEPRKLFEGLYAYRNRGYWYLFAAKGNYTSAVDPYEIVVGRCDTLGGVFIDKDGNRMDEGYASLILQPNTTNIYLGGAHTGEIFVDKTGKTFIFYQRQLAGAQHYRPLFLQEIMWGDDGWPYFKDGVTQINGIKPII